MVLWAVLLDLGVLTSWQMVEPLRRVVLQHGSQVITRAGLKPLWIQVFCLLVPV